MGAGGVKEAWGGGSVMRWGLTEKRGFICVWRFFFLAAEGASECTASPGLCFGSGRVLMYVCVYKGLA